MNGRIHHEIPFNQGLDLTRKSQMTAKRKAQLEALARKMEADHRRSQGRATRQDNLDRLRQAEADQSYLLSRLDARKTQSQVVIQDYEKPNERGWTQSNLREAIEKAKQKLSASGDPNIKTLLKGLHGELKKMLGSASRGLNVESADRSTNGAEVR